MLLVQGRRLRRETPRLPDAPLPWSGRVEPTGLATREPHEPDELDTSAPGEPRFTGDRGGASRPLHLLVLGDSTAAGVGVEHAELGLGGRLAEALSAHTGRPVHWRAAGRNGATARDLVRHFLAPALEGETHIVFLTVGANDALALRSARAFRRDIQRIAEAVQHEHPQAVLLMSSLPAFFRFRMLPEPLRRNLYRHSQALERAAREVIRATPRAHMSPPPPPYTEGFFASDDFHPSAIGYRDWAYFAVDDAVSVGIDRLIP